MSASNLTPDWIIEVETLWQGRHFDTRQFGEPYTSEEVACSDALAGSARFSGCTWIVIKRQPYVENGFRFMSRSTVAQFSGGKRLEVQS